MQCLTMAADNHTIWPFFDLCVKTPRLELRPMRENEVMDLARVVSNYGVHGPDEMPFMTPWTKAPSPELERGIFNFHMVCRAELSPKQWHLPFGVFLDGELIGSQALQADSFAVSKRVSTGSWLGRHQQGKGYGKEMRAGVLRLAFDQLHANRAETLANDDNVASQAVTRRLGYRDNGDQLDIVEDNAVPATRFVMDRNDYNKSAVKDYDVTFEGVGACLPLLGAS